MPEQIYWRRRAAAIAGALVVLVIVVVLFATQCGGPDQTTDTAAVSSSAAATTTEKSTETSATTSTSAAATTTEGEEAAAIAQGQCPDSAIGILVAVEKPNYAVGENPRFSTTITNIGSVPCARDLSDALTPNVVSTLDGNRLWASTDCFPGGESRVVTLEPGKQESTEIGWSGTTSNEGCTEERVQVGPGAYSMTAFNGGKASEPVTFNIG